MKDKVLASALKLSRAQRILLVEDIWDSIARESDAFPLSAAQKKELDGRIADAKVNPGRGATWEQVKAKLRKRSR